VREAATDAAAEPPVLVQPGAPVVTLRLNAVANRNALSAPLVNGLIEALTQAAADREVKGVLLTHSGPAFSSGADLVEARDRGMGAGTGRMLELLATIVQLPIPVIARLDGAVRAGGLGIVAACDMAFAGPRASFAFTETRLAIAPAVIALTVLPRVSSRGVGRYPLTGETFGAQQAAAIGLITDFAEDPSTLIDPVCESLAGCHRQGLEETKALVAAEMRERVAQGGPAAAELSARLFGSPEAHRLISALLAR
jgi:enoyl-CoA hydratase